MSRSAGALGVDSRDLAVQIARQRQLVTRGHTRPLAWRLEQLGRLEKALQPEEELLDGLAEDLRKPPVEAYYEISGVRQELKLFQRQLRHWLRPERVALPFIMQPAQARVVADPLGCVLIIGPWNYPLMLLLSPLVAALGAGNTAVLKPSEHAPRTGELLAARLQRHLDRDVVSVALGGPETAQALLRQRFDHVFFTGGNRIGRLVMEQAAKTLTPVTLETVPQRRPNLPCPGLCVGGPCSAGCLPHSTTTGHPGLLWGRSPTQPRPWPHRQ